MDKFQNKYRIPSTRLQKWDYGWNASYFVTICTANRKCYFDNIVDGEMKLSNIGVLADVFWHEIKNHAKYVELDEFVVMPNHVHGIIILNGYNYDNQNKNNDNNTNKNDYKNNNGNDNENGDGNGDGNGNVETRHALSLQQQQSQQSQQQSQQTIGKKRFQNQGKNTLSSIIGSYKSAVTKHANRMGFDFAWQSRFNDHIIRDYESHQRIRNYIIDNPKNWKNDKFYK